MEKFFNPFGGTGGSGGGGGGKVNNYTDGYRYESEQLCSFTEQECIYSTYSDVRYGPSEAAILARLKINDEAAHGTLQSTPVWNATGKCYYTAENKIGAYAGYIFNEPKAITKVKFWLSIYYDQSKTLLATVQYLNENDEWVDYTDLEISYNYLRPIMYTSNNTFEVHFYLPEKVKGIRWYHYKNPIKSDANDIVFSGMTVYEGVGEKIPVFNANGSMEQINIPQGYSGFGDLVINNDKASSFMSKTFTENGTYDAMLDGVDGYSTVTVDVQPALRYMTIDEVNNNGEPTKLHIYGQPGDSFNWFKPSLNTAAPTAFIKVTDITLDDNFVSFGQPNTFANYTYLTSINIPPQITQIPSSTFYKCTALNCSLDLSNITSIGDYGFGYCSALDISFDLSNVTSIGNYAFYQNTLLREVTITNKLTSIGNCAFKECRNMTGNLDLSGVTSLGEEAFRECNNLDCALDLSSLGEIKRYTFQNCKKIPSITLNQNYTMAYNSVGAFEGCESLTTLAQPSSYYSNTVYSHTYKNCKNLAQTFDLSNVTSIGEYAFENCAKVTGFTLGALGSLGNGAFIRCSSITSMDFPAGCTFTTLPTSVFEDCTSLSTVTFASDCKITIFSNKAFKNSGLTSIVIPPKCTTFYDEVFKDCSSLRTIDFSNINTIDIRSSCFQNCTSLEELDFSHLTSWNGYYTPYYMYKGCTSLKTVKFPDVDSVKLTYNAFEGDTNLTTVVYPSAGFVGIWECAFKGTGLTEFPTGAFIREREVSEHCFEGSKLQTAVLPSNSRVLRNYCFADCADLSSVTLPDDLETIQTYAFKNCGSLNEIVIPANASLGNYIFATTDGNDGVKKVYCKATSTNKLSSGTFSGNNSITDVYFTWSQPSSEIRYGLRPEATIHYDWVPD